MKVKHHWLVYAGLWVAIWSTGTALADGASSYSAEREWFLDAQKAIAAGETGRYTQLRKKLDDYPIVRYLDYLELHQRFTREKPTKTLVGQLNQFEQSTNDKSLTRTLTRLLQKRAAAEKQWSLFLGISESKVAADMPCETLQARVAEGQVKTLDDQALALWVEPKKRSKACSALLSKLEKGKTPPIKAIWQRIYNSVEAGKPDYAKSVLHYLGKRDKAPVLAWLSARDNPSAYLKSGKLNKDDMFSRRVLVDLVLLWSKQDPVAAMNHWLKVHERYTFYKDRYYDTHRLLAMRGAYRRLPEAYDWLNSLTARDDDLELKEWRIRAALFGQDWLNVLRSLKRLPVEEQEEDHWAYWEARALEESGHTPQADEIFTTLSLLPTYHGFLAADRIGADYAIADKPIIADEVLLTTLASQPGLVRAREYYAVDIPWQGRREWNEHLRDADSNKQAALAVLAERWELLDRAIYSAGLAKEKQALSSRFPVMYRSEVDTAAEKNRIPPAWVFGVMRRESAYMRDVKSSAGAIGLMQLMPNTAKYVAKLQGDKNWKGDLTDAATNIGFGTFYLRHVMDKFDDHQVLATASYNAGPHRVTSWLPTESMNADVWIDSIPYSETRRYVRAVLAYTAIYEWHLTGKPTRLSEKLRTVPPSEGT